MGGHTGGGFGENLKIIRIFFRSSDLRYLCLSLIIIKILLIIIIYYYYFTIIIIILDNFLHKNNNIKLTKYSIKLSYFKPIILKYT